MISRNGDPFKAYLLSQGRAPSTVRGYARYLRQWADWCANEGLTPVAATQADVGRWLQAQDVPANCLTALRSWYTYAVGAGLRPDDPTAAGRLKMLLPLPATTDPELERLLAEGEGPDEDGPSDTLTVDRPLDMAEVRRTFARVLDALDASLGMNASVNELLRQAAQFVELDGWASPGLLQRRLRVNQHVATALVETLRDEGILREEAPRWRPAKKPIDARRRCPTCPYKIAVLAQRAGPAGGGAIELGCSANILQTNGLQRGATGCHE